MPALGGFSRYELQERIGIGGMAEVFRARAWDASGSARDVVVKKILPHHDEEAEFRSMFMDEARIAANLDHPNVVRVLDLGRLDGDLFLAMEYVEGSDLLRLATWLEGANRRMEIGTALHIAMRILAALHHAHTRVDSTGRPLGIIHRDVTPQNVLVGLDASVKLTDFGIARAANRISNTVVGVIKGNLLYVAPEQISGQPIDQRADVYSAGILLHRLLSGRHAFEGDELPKVYQRSLAGDIPPASSFNPQVPTNLDLLVQKATSLAPQGRFQNAEEFRAALNEFLVGKQLAVDLDGLASDVRALRMGLRASPRDGRVLIAGAGSGGSELRSVASSAGTHPSPGNPLLDVDDDDDASSARTVRVNDDFAQEAPTNLQQIPRALTSAFDLSGSGSASATTNRVGQAAGEAGEAEEAKTEQVQVPPLPEAAPTVELEVNPFASLLGEEVQDDTTTRTAKSGSNEVPLPEKSPVSVEVEADDEAETEMPSAAGVAAAAALPGLAVFTALVEPAPPVPVPRLSTLPTMSEIPPPVVRTPPPRVSPPAPATKTGSAGTAGRIPTPPPWELGGSGSGSGTPGPSASAPAPPVDEIPPRAAVQAGSTLLAPRAADVFQANDLEEDESTKPTSIPAVRAEQIGLKPAQMPDTVLEGHEQPVVALATVREGRFVVSGSHDASVRLWDLTRRGCVSVLTGHTGPVTSVGLASDGARVVSGSADQTVRVWDPETGKNTATMKGHTDWVVTVAVAPDGRTALSGGADKIVRLWDLSTGKELLALDAQPSPVTALAYLGDGSLAVSATLDGVVALWNVLDGMPLQTFPTGVASLRTLALSRDGRRAVLGGADGQVRVWDLEKGAAAAAFPGHKGAVTSIALNADSSKALSGSADGTARLWDLATGKTVQTFGGHGPIASVAFAIDGHAALAAAQKRVLLWDL